MRNDLTPFRTVRELLANRDCVLMGNAVNTEGKLYDDSVDNLTAILAMQDSYSEMLAALQEVLSLCEGECAIGHICLNAIAKAKGEDA